MRSRSIPAALVTAVVVPRHAASRKGSIMTHATTSRIAAGTMVALAISIGGAASVALAFPDPGEPGAPGQHTTRHSISMHGNSRFEPLERLGTQYLRGDDLTGAGVPAPAWVPVLSW